MSSTLENLNEEVLGSIHEALANELLSRIKNGEATPTDLNVARQLLKDNNITVTPAVGSPLLNILDELPYDEKGTIIKSETIRETSGNPESSIAEVSG